MANRLIPMGPAILLASVALPADAQMSAPPIPSALPDVSSISQGNAAGVLQYCRQHQLISISVSDMVLQKITGKPEVLKSPDYAAGQAGRIITGNKAFSLGTANPYLQSQGCDMVLRQAQQFK
jgi:hypothetical protein